MADTKKKKNDNIEQIAPEAIPAHIAIIPDGNRRWARAHGLPIGAGHKKGIDVFKQIVEHCGNIGVKYLTFYAFSSENNKRSEAEVSELMSLLLYFLKNSDRELGKGRQKVRIRVIGRREGLSDELCEAIDVVEEKTKNNTGITVLICINYGGRDEIVDCVRSVAKKVEEGSLKSSDIDTALVGSSMYSGDIPSPDILIRSSGEKRISNFLLWGLAYTEFFFPEMYWPEFTPKDLDDIIIEFSKRNRRFGV